MDFKRRGGQKIIIKYWALLLNESNFNLLEQLFNEVKYLIIGVNYVDDLLAELFDFFGTEAWYAEQLSCSLGL